MYTMKIKTIFWIVVVLTVLQVFPLLLSLISPEFKLMLLADDFGHTPLETSVKMFEQFALVVGSMALGMVFMLIGATSFTDQAVLRRISFLFAVMWGFFALPDLVNVLLAKPVAPLPVVLMGLVSLGLLFYGSKKGTV